MDPEVFTSYEDIAKLPTRIRSIFKAFKVDVLPGADLEKYLELCERAEETIGLLSKAQSVELQILTLIKHEAPAWRGLRG